MKKEISINEEYLIKDRCFLLEHAPLNFLYDKEIFFTDGVKNESTVFQIVGNFGAYPNQALENIVNVFVISDCIYLELLNGVKAQVLLDLEKKLNSKGQPFSDLKIITESALLEFAKKRVSFYDDKITNELIKSLHTENDSFVAIDFETANSKFLSSACEIGMVKVKNGLIVDKFHSLIRPPEDDYSVANTLIHGITAEQTKNSPTFAELWPKIKSFIGNNSLVAHNISSDLNILSKCLEYYGLEKPNFKSICTYKIFGTNLDQLCQAYSIDRLYHNALIDAEACAMIYLNYIHDIKPDFLKSDGIKHKSNLFDFSGHDKIDSDYLKPNFENGDCDCPFFKQKVVITGVFSKITRQEIAQMLQEKGADVDTSITDKTNYLIAGADPGPSKIRTLEALKSKGKSIQLISEQQFLDMINGRKRIN